MLALVEAGEAAGCLTETLTAEAGQIGPDPDRLACGLLLLAGQVDQAAAALAGAALVGWSRPLHPGPVVLPYLLVAATGAAPPAAGSSSLGAAFAAIDTALHQPYHLGSDSDDLANCHLIDDLHDFDEQDDATRPDAAPADTVVARLTRQITESGVPEQRRRQWLSVAGTAVENRVDAIVSSKHRRAYERAAALAVAYTEALVATGTSPRRAYLTGIRVRYPRHSAFRAEADHRAFLPAPSTYGIRVNTGEPSDFTHDPADGRSWRADRRSSASAQVGAMADSGDPARTDRAAVVSPAADATTRGRWRALVLTDPVARLVRNAVHADVDGDTYDLRQLALAAIDLVVASMGFAREATLDEVVDTLTGVAARMQPAEEHAHQWRDVAQVVVKGLLNDAHLQRTFSYAFADLADLADPDAVRWEPYDFRLLSLRDTEYGPVLVASDQAVLLYLHGLDVDIEDADAALAHVLQRQLDDRRFDAAVGTATQAERTSIAMSAQLADLLEATNRDVRSHDWLVDVPGRLERARRHVHHRIGEDDHFLDHVQAGLDAGTSAAVRAASGQIVDLLQRAKQVHLDLERRLIGARQVFLSAQVRQRLAPRRRLRLLAMGAELFVPTLALPAGAATAVVDRFAEHALGVSVPRLIRFDDVLDTLWAPPRVREAPDATAEDPGDDTDTGDIQRYAEAVLRAARDIVRVTRTAPVRLSTLLDAAATVDPAAVEGAVDDVIELVLLSSLWAFAPDVTDEEISSQVDLLASGLRAVDDGTPMRRHGADGTDGTGATDSVRGVSGIWGADLLVTAAATDPTSDPAGGTTTGTTGDGRPR
ncbi:MAG: hypothetical protein HY241_09950 [Actinobacteria bacterium]|nr:hypothetical protein [Actinomycetota bacterium]